MIPRRRIPLPAQDLWTGVVSVMPRRNGLDRARVARFEQAFAKRMDVRHALATASGRDALMLIVDALGLAAGDEMIVPAYTLGELMPILQARGLRLVPADIDPDTWNMTPDSVRARIGPATRAILAVHLLGAPCAVDAIGRLADAHGIPLIEDCAHAPGGQINGRPLGSFGRAALFSLEATKAISAYGGGMLITGDAALAERAHALLSVRTSGHAALRKAAFKWVEEFGVRSPLYGPVARVLFDDRNAGRFEAAYRGAHARLRGAADKPPQAFSAFQATVALRRLTQLDARTARLNALWIEMARQLPPRFTPQRRDAFGTPAFYNFVARFAGDVRLLRRAALRRGLDLGIGSEVMDDTARLLGYDDCPRAAEVFASAVLIPLYDGMDARRLRQVVDILHAAAREVP